MNRYKVIVTDVQATAAAAAHPDGAYVKWTDHVAEVERLKIEAVLAHPNDALDVHAICGERDRLRGLLRPWADSLPPNGDLYWHHVALARAYFSALAPAAQGTHRYSVQVGDYRAPECECGAVIVNGRCPGAIEPEEIRTKAENQYNNLGEFIGVMMVPDDTQGAAQATCKYCRHCPCQEWQPTDTQGAAK
jgi:hypothetical protein